MPRLNELVNHVSLCFLVNCNWKRRKAPVVAAAVAERFQFQSNRAVRASSAISYRMEGVWNGVGKDSQRFFLISERSAELLGTRRPSRINVIMWCGT